MRPRRTRTARAYPGILFAIFVWAGPSLPVSAQAAGDPEQGHDLYNSLCSSCHGQDMVNPGLIGFNLRQFPDDFNRFQNSVLNGKGQAMPALRDQINDEDLANLWAYVRIGAEGAR
jgi:mono/diheme cytochrome c family protein